MHSNNMERVELYTNTAAYRPDESLSVDLLSQPAAEVGELGGAREALQDGVGVEVGVLTVAD